MKYITFSILTMAISAILSFSVHAQSDKQFSKMQEKQYKDKSKELKKAGWVASGETFTLDFALAKFYRALFADANNLQWVGHVANCRATCADFALSDAQSRYAQQASAYVQRQVTGGMSNNESASQLDEFKKICADYEILVSKEMSGLLKQYLAIERPNKSGGKEYEIWYVINETDASNARSRAMDEALEKTKTDQEFSDLISKHVRDAFTSNEN